MTDASTSNTFFTPFKTDLSALKEIKDDKMKCKISRRKGTCLENCFLHAVSEILEIPGT